MKIERYQCDVCGGVKGEANKWVRVRDAGKGAFHVYYWNFTVKSGTDEEMFVDGPVFHICGARCLLTKLQGFLDRNV